MDHEEFVLNIISNVNSNGYIKCRERIDLEYKETFSAGNFSKYAKTMASFSNRSGGYIIFGVKDNPRVLKGVNSAFFSFEQEKFTECLNSMFSPEILWSAGMVEIGGKRVGYIFTAENPDKPVMALKNDSSEKINSGDVFYRYRARTEKIKYPEMRQIIDDNKRKEQERIIKLVEEIRNSNGANIGIVNYTNGRFTTPYGVDVEIDKKLVVKVLKQAKYIKAGMFDEKDGAPVIKVTGNIDLAEEIPVPDIEPDIGYPYFEKDLMEKLGVNQTTIRSLVFYFKIKKQKKFHQETTTARSGKYKTHKYSDVALQFLAEQINKNKNDGNWLERIISTYKERGVGNNG